MDQPTSRMTASGAAALFGLLPTELGHALGLQALRLPIWGLGARVVEDPFEWRGLRFRNRVGIAAGLDKNGVAVRSLAHIGAGFVEVGTVVTRPWPGQPRPRLLRLRESGGLWNRLGFPSHGVARVAARLASTPRVDGFVLGCNIAPHPLTVRRLGEGGQGLESVREELLELVAALHAYADFFVINLSSPNTPGLRALFQSESVCDALVRPTLDALRAADARAGRRLATRLLLKLPPEESSNRGWTPETLARFLAPFANASVCDGFVAVNTSTRLALSMVPLAREERPGGVSGSPLHPLALEVMQMLRSIAPDQLRIGVGGIGCASDAQALLRAGAHLVELYSGLVYRGPRLVRECAAAIASGAGSEGAVSASHSSRTLSPIESGRVSTTMRSPSLSCVAPVALRSACCKLRR
jgi:dihydroorotate dehydrogenase